MTIKPVYKKLKEPLFVVDEANEVLLPVDTIFCINGYDFGDRLLEDVMFKAQLSEDRKTLTVIGVNDVDYFEDLNTTKWMKEALNYFLSGVDYVFPDNQYNQTDWMLLTEKTLEEHYPTLYENRNEIVSVSKPKKKK